MQTSEWVLIFTALFLGAVALFVPYLAELLKRTIFAPKLKIEFDLQPPDCHITRLKGPDASGERIDEPVFYFRFRVINSGNSQARRCEAVLQSISTADASGRFNPHKRFTPVNLVWGGSYGEYVDINPDRRFYCDLIDIASARVQKAYLQNDVYVDPLDSKSFDLGMHLCVKAAFYSQPNRLPPGRYQIQVSIYSENAETLTRKFEVAWSGEWKDSEEAMFREAVLRLID